MNGRIFPGPFNHLLELARRTSSKRAERHNTLSHATLFSRQTCCFLALSAGQGSLSAGETEIWFCVVAQGFNIDSWTINPAA